MLTKDWFLKLTDIIKKHFLMPFCLSVFSFFLLIYILGFKTYFIDSVFILCVGIIFAFIAFALWFGKLDKKSKFRELTLEFLNRLFLISLLLVVIFNFIELNLSKNTNLILISISLFSGAAIFYANKETNQKIVECQDNNNNEKKSNKKYFYLVISTFAIFLFLFFGLNHLGKFMSVDEPKWVDVRAPQLFKALEEHKWEDTYINDKPGVLPVFLSGMVNVFLSHDAYKSNPLIYEKYLFFWRLPIIIFNFLILFIIYYFTKKLFKKEVASLVIILIALNPILIGISQIVNPDATLWSTGLLSFITFFLYLKTNAKKYIFYSGLFLGLALISKYFASLFYVVFLLTVYFEYLFNKTTRNQLFKRLWDTSVLFFISIMVYAVLFPATWIKPLRIIKGTIGADILLPGKRYIILFFFLIIAELILFKGKISNYIKNHLNIEKILIRILVGISILILIALIINLIFNNLYFDFNEYFLTDFVRGSSVTIKTTAVSLYTTLFVTPYPTLLGIILLPFIVFNNKSFRNIKEHSLLMATIIGMVFIFFVGSTLGGYVADTRYQTIIYPLISILASICIFALLKYYKIIISIAFIILFLNIIKIQPFYFLYTNNLNVRNYTITEAWGFAGYELAQKFNQMKNVTIWSDREGFNEFFLGKSYWRGNTNPFDDKTDINYLILSTGGKKIFLKALKDYENGKRYFYTIISQKTPLLKYYEKIPDYKICIQNNPNNCVWAVKK